MVWFFKLFDLVYDGVREFFECGEVVIMRGESAQMLPDAFNGIKVRTVRRQEIEPQDGLASFEKGREE